MNLLETIETARKHIQNGKIHNEYQVRLAVIQPSLRALGWDTTDPDQVVPEFGISRGRVDYALLGEDGTPLVLIETKAHNRITEDSLNQLFRYAYDAGAGIIVLTDGQKWELYLSSVTGVDKRNRLFCELDLTINAASQCEQLLSRYLDRRNTYGGEAFESARVDFEARRSAERREKQEKQDRDKLMASLPNIWEELKQDQTSPLYELMSRAIANAGLKGYPEVLAEFISQLGLGRVPPTSESSPERPQVGYVSEQPPHSPPEMAGPTKTPRSKIVGYTLYGRRYDTRNNPGTLQMIFSEFINRDPELVSKLEQARPKWFTSSRRFIAETLEKLYRNPNQRHRTRRLDNGYYIDINLGTYSVKEHIEEGCKIVGLRYGTDLVLHETLKSQPQKAPYVADELTTVPQHEPINRDPRKYLIGYTLYDKRYSTNRWKEVLIGTFNEFIARDLEFVSNFKRAHPRYWTNRKQLIADRQNEVYLKAPHLMTRAYQLNNGQWMDTVLGQGPIVSRIKDACEVMGLRYGVDLIIHEEHS